MKLRYCRKSHNIQPALRIYANQTALYVKALVGAFNQDKVLVRAFSAILREGSFEALV